MLIDTINRNGVRNNQSGGYAPKVSLKQVQIADKISAETVSVIEAYVGEVLDRKNLTYSRETGAAGHFEEDEVRFIIVALAARMDEDDIYASLQKARTERGVTTPAPRTLVYYRRKYAELIDQVWVTFATRIGEIYNYTDKVYRLSKWNALASALEGYVIPNIKAGVIDKTLTQVTNLYMNTMKGINLEMGGVTLKKITENNVLPDEPSKVIDGVDIEKTLEALVAKRFRDQLPEPKKIENGVGISVTESS